jgi:WXXGXW repeat (2 copies)
MIKYILPAAVAAIALGAPAMAEAQTAALQPMPLTTTTVTSTGAVNTNVNANATITGQPQPGPNDFQGGQAYAAPMPGPYMGPAITPRTTWIPSGYSWDPNRNNYVWTDGRFVEAPSESAQWVPGHWAQTPTAWIWVAGRWN